MRQHLGKYVLLQLPGYGITGLILFGAWRLLGLPGWVCVALFAVVVVKDVVMFPIVRRSMGAPAHSGAESMLGARGVAVDALTPQGRVRLGAELWQAESLARDARIDPGTPIRVEEVRGLTVLVRPEE
jgi:membrane protein implicated in regulation of membrane protease activity